MKNKLVHDPRNISDKYNIIRQYNYALTRYFNAKDYLKILEGHLLEKSNGKEVFELTYVKELQLCIKVTKAGVSRLHKELLHYDKLREIWWDTIGQETYHLTRF